MDIVVKSGVMFMQEEKAPEVLSDCDIISLFFGRNEKALDAVSRKYGAYCATVIRNILENEQETEECLNDAINNIDAEYINSAGKYLKDGELIDTNIEFRPEIKKRSPLKIIASIAAAVAVVSTVTFVLKTQPFKTAPNATIADNSENSSGNLNPIINTSEAPEPTESALESFTVEKKPIRKVDDAGLPTGSDGIQVSSDDPSRFFDYMTEDG